MEWSHLFVVEDACQWAVNCVFPSTIWAGLKPLNKLAVDEEDEDEDKGNPKIKVREVKIVKETEKE